MDLSAGPADGRARAVVAMSGGVDSSTTAALLLEQGYEVVGITMQLYDYNKTAAGERRSGTCCSLDDVHDARRVAERLGIPFYVVNFQEAFQALIVDNLADEYFTGRTPNPCVRCNEFMKFRLLLDRAMALGGDFLATGHYARIDACPETGRFRLRKAVHAPKDQSYFLYPVGQKQLSKLRFPLGNMTKAEVRAHAERFALPTAQKAESQDVCFIAGESYKNFLARSNSERLPGEGELVSVEGMSLGKHPGHHHFTVGQRRGIGVASAERQYVLSIDASNNRVVVGGGENLDAGGLTAGRMRWIAGHPPSANNPVQVKIRYRSEAVNACVVAAKGFEARILFAEPVRAVTPGQAAVVYDGDEVLGGGIIESALPSELAGAFLANSQYSTVRG